LTSNNTLGSIWGDAMGYVLESLIIMHNTTNDYTYLDKFINLSFHSISSRQYWHGLDYKAWSDHNPNNSSRYQDGLALWPLAHFCYYIKTQKNNLNNYIILNNNFNLPNGVVTLGNYVDWLLSQIYPTINGIILNYFDNTKGFRHTINQSSGAARLNQNLALALPLLYMSFTPNYFHLQFLIKQYANLFNQSISISDRCLGTCIQPYNIELPLFHLNLNNNSYWWYSNGWRVNKWLDANCGDNNILQNNCVLNSDNYLDYTWLVEDGSHAITDLMFVKAAYELGLNNTNDSELFYETDMIRFKNTFTKNLYSFPTNSFKNRVDGNNLPDDNPEDDCGNLTGDLSLDDCYLTQMTAFSFLYNFDFYQNNPSSVYSIIMNLFHDRLYNSPSDLGGAIQLYGLSEAINMQWNIECYNLNLYNRKINSNISFYAKNNLIVAPNLDDENNDLNSNSFAEPIITENKFTIEPGVSCTMKAGERIVLKPGFHAKAGSNFRAYIEPNLCTDGQIVPPGGGGNNEPNYESWVAQANTKSIKQQEEHSAQTTTNTSLNDQKNNLPKQEFNIRPNPNTGIFSIYVQTLNEQEHLQLSVMDVFGKQIINQQINNSSHHQIDLSAYSKGIYYVSVTGSNGFREVKKVVVS
jgi:hypothetical protein